MAFKFKVKKRPSLAQAAAGGFAQGVATGINQAAQLSLQDRLRKQEEEKNRLKKELDLFNGMVGNIEQSSTNREAILKGKKMIIRTDGKVGASQAFSSISPDFTFTPTKAEKEADTILSKDADIMAAETSAMQSINMGGLKPSESVVTRRETLADIQAGVKADPRSTTEIIDPDTGEKRLVTKGKALQPGVITELAPDEKFVDVIDETTGKTVKIKASDQEGRVTKLAPTVNLQYKVDEMGNQFTFNPSTGELNLVKKGEKLSETSKLELKNLLQERTRLLALKKGQSKSTFNFPEEMSFTMDSGGASWDDKVNQPQLDRIDNVLINKYKYDWLVEFKDGVSTGKIDLQRPPSIPEEAWSKSTQEQKVEAVRLYEASLKPTSENVNSMPQGEQSSEVEVSDSGQQPPSGVDIGFTPQAPNTGMKFRLPPELVKQFDSGSVVVESMKGDKIILKTDKGIKKVMPLSKWYTYRFAPMT